MSRASALYERYEQAPEHVAVLDAAIGLLRRCLGLVRPDDAERIGQVMLRLGTALCKRWEAEGGARFREGVELLARAVEKLRNNPAELTIARSNLAAMAPAMYLATADDRWRREGVAAARASLALGGTDEDLAAASEGLAHNMAQRFEVSGDTTALREAMAAFQAAVRGTPVDGPHRARRVCGLAKTFSLRYDVERNTEDLDLAVELVRVALRMVPADHPDVPMMLDQLASLLRAPEHRDLARMEEAVTLSAAALEKGSLAGLDRLMFQLNHVSALLQLFSETRRAELLTTADKFSAEVLTELPSCHAARASAQYVRGTVDLQLGDHEKALAHLEEAARTPDAPRRQIKAARLAASVAARAGMWAPAAEMLAYAVSILPRLVSRRLVRVDQERLLAECVALSRDACAYAIQSGDAVGALVVLEQGRALLFQQLLDDRDDLAELRRIRPDLAARIDACQERFADPAARDEVHVAAEEWDRAVAEARALPGFETLFGAPGFDELREAAADGPVVVINVAALRTDALVLTLDGVEVVELPAAHAAAAQEWFREFTTAANSNGAGLPETLAWLWDAIGEPVLDRLKIGPHEAGEPWPRIWWSPTGPLIFLPLQCAGRHSRYGDAVMDRVVSSNAPWIRAMVRARKRPAIPPDEARLLVVSVPEAPGLLPLPAARREAEYLREHGPDTVTVLDGAVRADVLDAWPRHEHAHVACHVDQNVRIPTAARLIMVDHVTAPLTLLDVARLGLNRAEFLFLSVCAGGRGGIALTEEAVDLASAFQVTGYRHVVATLWPIRDSTALAFTKRVHRMVNEKGADAAPHAVHRVARLLRDRGKPPITWASHIHVGP
jgi:tetratricopeptide (TPR) repeat protein